MLFNFDTFFSSLPLPVSKQYSSLFGQPTKIEDCSWYKYYVSRFDIACCNYNVPEELKCDFDWQLLAQLAFASFSCDADLLIEGNGLELYIRVSSDGQIVTKKVSELWSFQIHNLYEIFIKEQIELAILSRESIKERMAIDYQKSIKLERANKHVTDPKNLLVNLPINLN